MMAEDKPALLGRRTVAAAVTTPVKQGANPALGLMVGAGPPLAVDSDIRASNLNADKLDDKHLEDISPILVAVRRDRREQPWGRGLGVEARDGRVPAGLRPADGRLLPGRRSGQRAVAVRPS